MSVVKINVIEVPEGMGPELEKRFAARANAVDGAAGFEEFQLLRPVEGETRYFVYTRWASEDDFQAWFKSEAFQHGHSQSGSAEQRPVGSGSSVLGFEVILRTLNETAQ